MHVKNGKAVKIEGDPNHPMNKGYVCVKGGKYMELLYHPDRLKYPLKRAGERGEGKWKRITWDEALVIIADEFRRVKEEYGPESTATSVGTGPRGNMFAAILLAYAAGSPNVMSITHVCYVPSVMAEWITWGGPDLMQERGPDYDNTNCILVWAANPLSSHPPRGNDIVKAKKRGAKLIVVDPRRTVLAERADLWLQIRPGTDAALALGMLNTIINDELFDRDFVGKWCVGFDELKERVQEYPLDEVSKITWIPESKIRDAAITYATTKPAALHRRVSIEQSTNAIQTLRALAILIAITGNLDVKGGNVFYTYPSGYIRASLTDAYLSEYRPPKEVERKRLGADKFPLFSGPDSPSPFAHNPTVIKAMLTGKPYPVKALFAFNNLIICSENSREVWEALKKLEFLAVAEFFMTPTAELADIVLPSATWVEKNELCDTSYTNYVSAMQKAIEPVGECWDDKKTVIELAKKLSERGFDEARRFLPWNSVDEFNNFRLSRIGTTFDDLKEKGYIIVPVTKHKRYEERGFQTPSGKVELCSSIFEKYGYDPLPRFKEPPESPVSTPELAKDYPFILITGGRHIAYFHSEGRQIPSLRKLCSDPMVEIHPDVSKELGIKSDDWVEIETPRGRVTQKARVTTRVHQKVIHVQHGWWFPEESGPEHGCFKSNVNVAISNDAPYDPICGAVQLRGLLCRVRKAKYSNLG